MKSFSMLGLCSALLAVGAVAPAATVVGTLRHDVWHYPFNTSPATRAIAPLFVTTDTPFAQFDTRDGVAVLVWEVAVPPALVGQPLSVVSASVVFYDEKGAEWNPVNTNSFGQTARIELFAAGFGPVNTESGWAGTWASPFGPQPGSETGRFQGGYIIPGSTPVISTRARDPFPRDLATNSSVSNDVITATPWAVGQISPSYVPDAMTDAFPVSFSLDVSNPTIQAELLADLTSGLSSWVVSSTWNLTPAGAGPGDPPTLAPQIILRNGVGNSIYGTSQLAPALVIEVETTNASSAASWSMYE